MAEMEKMLRPLIGEHIALVTVLDPALGPVNADSGQLGQVIMNLAVNARDAMPQGGRIVLKTANAQIDEATAARQPGLQAGRYAVLAVSDTGVGMDATTQARTARGFTETLVDFPTLHSRRKSCPSSSNVTDGSHHFRLPRSTACTNRFPRARESA